MPLCVMFLGQTFSASYIACKKQIVHVALHYIQYCFEFVLRSFKGGKKITSKKTLRSPVAIFLSLHRQVGHAVAQLVEALRYKPEGSGFDFRWCHWNFSLT